MERLRGELESVGDEIVGYLSGVASLEGELTVESSIGIEGELSHELPDNPVFLGPYTVTPKAEDGTTLDTAFKLMIDDVKVKPIPYYETSNDSGGYTVYIAGEVEIE